MAAKADWAAYLRRYPDLKEAFGDDKKLAEKHWFEYGFNEKRDPLPGKAERIARKADWAAYIRRYPDLKEAFGHDVRKAEKHWYEYGFSKFLKTLFAK